MLILFSLAFRSEITLSSCSILHLVSAFTADLLRSLQFTLASMAAGCSMAAEQQHTAAEVLCGQVTHRRRVSSKLVFYDLLQSDTLQWWEVVVKAGTYGGVQAVKDLRDSLK